MIRHVLVLRWVPGVTPDQAEKAARALNALPEVIPALREMRAGTDIGVRDTSWDFALVALFDDVAGFRSYLDHPEHLRVSQEYLTPIIAERASVQSEI